MFEGKREKEKEAKLLYLARVRPYRNYTRKRAQYINHHRRRIYNRKRERANSAYDLNVYV